MAARIDNGFVNASLKWNVRLSDKSIWSIIPPLEIQVVYVWNKNESGYSKHEIYDSKKLLSVLSRLFWYVTLADIKLIIQEIWIKSWLPEMWILYYLLAPKNKKSSSYLLQLKNHCDRNLCFVSKDVRTPDIDKLYSTWIEYKSFDTADFDNIWQKYLDTKI